MADLPASSSLPSDPAQLLARLGNGETLEALASEYGIHKATLYRYFLRAGGPAEYYEAKVAAHQARIYHADESLEHAEDMLAYNKAHARAKLARLDYERTCPKEYGQKQELTTDNTIRVIIEPSPGQLRRMQTQVIDSNPAKITDDSVSE